MAKTNSKSREIVIRVAVSKIKPNPWGAEVGPPLNDEDYRTLKASIRRGGIHIPLIVWRRGKQLVVLSGSNRLRIAKELGIKFVPVIVREFADQHAAKTFAVSDNLARRQMTTGQRAYLAYEYQQLIGVGAGRRTDLQPLSTLTKVNARQIAAEKAGVSAGSMSAMKTVMESGDEELLQTILHGKITVHEAKQLVDSPASIRRKVLGIVGNGGAKRKVSRMIREAVISARKASAIRYASTNGAGDDQNIICGDMKLLWKRLDDASVKMILTDPPYLQPELYGRLAELAAAKLMPGGLCLAYAEPGKLVDVLDEMRRHLTYWWTFAVPHVDVPRYVNDRHVQNKWKPIIAFGKGAVPLPPEWLGDFLEGGGRDKRFHVWGQPESEARYLVTRLTEVGDLVDPYAGGGTVPAVCKALGRRWLATEIEKETVAIARKRLADLELKKRAG
jgi:hypothetical protein